jgi:hypothetical protein
MKVLIACEESQTVCKAFRELGHEAYSNDIQECSGGHPEWHLNMDCFQAIELMDWDLMIAHPPCTHLAVSGMRWFKEGCKGQKPLYLQDQAADFFIKLTQTKIKHWAIENPICIMSTRYRKPDQIINPFQFGHPEQKKTCLWLGNLPKLQETDNVYDYMMTLDIRVRTRIHWLGSNHAKERSRTFSGIAQAMATQWSKYIIESSGT